MIKNESRKQLNPRPQPSQARPQPGQPRPQSGQTRPQQGRRPSARRGFGRAGNRQTSTQFAPPSALAAPVQEKRLGEPADLRFVPLGGLEEIGRNCYFFEYRNEIIIVDLGIQFPEEATPGIDYIIPNIAYLQSKRENIRAIFLTHGHYDHIAAIHYLIEKLGNPVIYAADFTKAIVEKRHTEFVNAPKLRFEVVKHRSRITVGNYFEAEFFNVDHTIPDALGFILETPVGNMVSFGDFRLKTNKQGKPIETEIFEEIGSRGIHSIFVDSTNALRPGFSFSEENVSDNLAEIMKAAKGRLIIATFSSLMTRLFEIVGIAEKLDKKIALNGRSMKDNFMIAQQLGYVKPKKGSIIPLEEINKYPDNKLLVLTTGSQGEPNAGLMRIVNGEHRLMRLKQSDSVIFSSSVIPGNERSVQSLQDNIARQVDELYNVKILDLHASGHAHQEDLKLVFKLTKPRYIVPIHGYYFFRSAMRKIAETVGISRDRVMMLDNGQVADLSKEGFAITNDAVPASYVMVDGLGVGDVEEVVIRDRRNLAAEGMIVVIVTVDKAHGGRLLKNPDIISRGFIYLKENQEILDEVRKRIRGLMSRLPANQEADVDYMKTLIRDQIAQFLYNKTKRRPMILPVVIEI